MSAVFAGTEKLSAVLTDISLGANEQRILLVAPPALDFRLDWPQWHQPTGLLKLATWLRKQKKDVRLIDGLQIGRSEHLTRHKVDTLELEEYNLHRWQLGLPIKKFEVRLRTWLLEPWVPDLVFVTSLNSVWWESTRDTIASIRGLLPQSKIILGGVYPTVDLEHAVKHSGADYVFAGSVAEAEKSPPDLSLYDQAPHSAGIHFYSRSSIFPSRRALKPRPVETIVKEVKKAAARDIRELVFFDELIRLEDRVAFGELLTGIAKADLNVRFVLPGNVEPRLITQDLARKLRQAQVTQVYLHCDLSWNLEQPQYTTPLAEYDRCVKALVKAGNFAGRGSALAAMLVVGLPYEDLDQVTERLIHLSHIAGSVVVVPFQYVPGLHKGPIFSQVLAHQGPFSPEVLNSKTFLLARLSGRKFDDYMELVRLSALLNSKYHSRTFDFLGSSLSARMFRDSLRNEGWNPFSQSVTTGVSTKP